jgi:hypothetical protein
MNDLINKPIKSTYPTLKEVFIDEISFDVAHNFVKRIANRHNKDFYKKLAGIAKIVVRLYEMGLTPSDALKRMESIFRKFPELNPEKNIDSTGVKMFIQTMIKHRHESGNAKRFYDNVINALLRTKYKIEI